MTDTSNGKGDKRRDEDRKKVSDRWPFKERETQVIKRVPKK